ncbi:hypothetical protein HK16_10980 [Acetobacter senegalensis]|uniref:Uncharacterized protein n=2 Tax=Acetobacter TaxID=434 RepID=A0A252EIM1_9PROT|nr:hypothetical protein CIW82_10805 [Acetobacter tropicalis]OUL66267.1 hypothetical protein HK16_10980 [Acetobacter senegalensis]
MRVWDVAGRPLKRLNRQDRYGIFEAERQKGGKAERWIQRGKDLEAFRLMKRPWRLDENSMQDAFIVHPRKAQSA